MDKSLQVAGAPAETPKPVYLVRYTSIEGWRVASEEAYWTFSECNRRILYEAAHPAPIAGDVEKDALDVPQQFHDFVAANYNGVIDIHRPEWHAKRLWNAAMKARAAMLANSSSGEAG